MYWYTKLFLRFVMTYIVHQLQGSADVYLNRTFIAPHCVPNTVTYNWYVLVL